MPPIPSILIVAIAIAVPLVFWPRHGLRDRWRRARAARERILLEDFLKHIHARALQGNSATLESLAGSCGVRIAEAMRLISTMQVRGLVRTTGAGFELTSTGDRSALQLIRAHRLLERYLADELRMPIESIHATADRREHGLTPAEVDELEVRLGYPRTDPHGDPIPSGTGSLSEVDTTPLIDWPEGRPARIVHLEDEPSEVFAQISAAGLVPGMKLEILDQTEHQLVLWDGAKEYLLPHMASGNVYVSGIPHPLEPVRKLDSLRPGDDGVIRSLECEGFARRRLLDLGLTPGTHVRCEFASTLGEPVAYRVRGALIALRSEETALIEIEKADTESESS